MSGQERFTDNEIEALEAAAAIADAFEEENMRMCGDSIINDPMLAKYRHGAGLTITQEDEALSETCQTDGLIHSSMAKAARDIASAIRELKGRPAAEERG